MGRLQDLELALILKLADRVSYPSGRIQKAAQAMSGRLKETREALRQVQDQASKVEHLQQLNSKLGSTSAKLAEAKREAEYFRRMIEVGGKAGVRAFGKDLDRANAKISKLSAAERKLAGDAHAVQRELRKAGIDTSRLGDTQTKLKQRTEQLTASLEKQERQLKKLKQLPAALSARWEIFKGKMKSFALWGGILAGTAGAVGGGLVLPMLNKAAEFEGYESVLKVIEGSREKAQASMKWVENFATKTPYELAEVTDAFVRLRAYGLDPTSGLMKTLGDTSAAMNKPIMAAVEAIADAVTGENERLKEFGIKAKADGDLFRYQYTDKNGIQRELAAMKDDRKAIEQALRRIWSEKFDGSMEEKSTTWTGIVSNLKDMWSKFQRMVMASGPFEKLKAQAMNLLTRLNTMAENGQLQAWADKVGAVIVKVIDGLIAIAPKIWGVIEGFASFSSALASFMGGWDNLAVAVAGGQLVSGVAQVLLGFKNIGTTLLWVGRLAMAHPMIALISAIALGALWVINNWDTVKGWASGFWDWLTAKFAAGWEAIKQVFLNWTPLGIMIKHWDDVMAFYANLGQRLVGAGRAIIDGLRAGIEERWQAIKARIMELADLLPDWLKAKLEIHSPSRVFARLGGHISEGIGVGIQQRAGTALGAVQRLGARLPGALPTAMAVGLTAAGAAHAGALPGGAGAPVVIQATIHVHAAPGQDAEAIAREVARQIAQLQRQANTRARSVLHDED